MMPPMRVSIELVPRDIETLRAQVADTLCLDRVTLTNLPDLLRFGLRSWDAALLTREQARLAGRDLAAVPHVRAMDVELAPGWEPGARMCAGGIDSVVVVQGDPPDDVHHAVSGASSVEVIAKLRREHPSWTIYGALDPYRQSIAQERDYALRKLDAGADGFFTQPFFDLRLMGAWRELVPRVPVFWGVTSVTSVRSMRYWTTRNRAVFPGSFEPTLAWHRAFAADVVHFAEAHDADLYFMPIRVKIGEWLGDVLQ
ncbi:methylenetetrahydrofolate reductase [soil metagenome]|nr:methylenetetrahydrofolate reductase [Trueperaceae bacterium]